MGADQTPHFDDGRIGSRIEAYTTFWQKDPKKEQEDDTQNRIDSYTDVINGEHDAVFSPQDIYVYQIARLL